MHQKNKQMIAIILFSYLFYIYYKESFRDSPNSVMSHMYVCHVNVGVVRA